MEQSEQEDTELEAAASVAYVGHTGFATTDYPAVAQGKVLDKKNETLERDAPPPVPSPRVVRGGLRRESVGDERAVMPYRRTNEDPATQAAVSLEVASVSVAAQPAARPPTFLRLLPLSEVTIYDIFKGQGKGNSSRFGNQRCRSIYMKKISEYGLAGEMAKRRILDETVKEVKSTPWCGISARLLQETGIGFFKVLSDKALRDRISHGLRDNQPEEIAKREAKRLAELSKKNQKAALRLKSPPPSGSTAPSTQDSYCLRDDQPNEMTKRQAKPKAKETEKMTKDPWDPYNSGSGNNGYNVSFAHLMKVNPPFFDSEKPTSTSGPRSAALPDTVNIKTSNLQTKDLHNDSFGREVNKLVGRTDLGRQTAVGVQFENEPAKQVAKLPSQDLRTSTSTNSSSDPTRGIPNDTSEYSGDSFDNPSSPVSDDGFLQSLFDDPLISFTDDELNKNLDNFMDETCNRH